MVSSPGKPNGAVQMSPLAFWAKVDGAWSVEIWEKPPRSKRVPHRRSVIGVSDPGRWREFAQSAMLDDLGFIESEVLGAGFCGDIHASGLCRGDHGGSDRIGDVGDGDPGAMGACERRRWWR